MGKKGRKLDSKHKEVIINGGRIRSNKKPYSDTPRPSAPKGSNPSKNR